MSDKLLMTQSPRDMRESFIDSMQEASKINREMFSMADWISDDDKEGCLVAADLVAADKEEKVSL